MTGSIASRRSFFRAGGAFALRLIQPRGDGARAASLAPSGVETHEPLVFRPAVSPRGEILAFASGSENAHAVWGRRAGATDGYRRLRTADAPPAPIVVRSLDADESCGVVWMEEEIASAPDPSRLVICRHLWEADRPERLASLGGLGLSPASPRRLRQTELRIDADGRRILLTTPGDGVHSIDLKTLGSERLLSIPRGHSLAGGRRQGDGGFTWFSWDPARGESVRTLRGSRWEVAPARHLARAGLDPLNHHTVFGSMWGQHAVLDLRRRVLLWLDSANRVRDELSLESADRCYSPAQFAGEDTMLLEEVRAGSGGTPAEPMRSRLVFWTARDKGGLRDDDQAH